MFSEVIKKKLSSRLPLLLLLIFVVNLSEMSKTRFSTTDTKAMVRDIRATLLGQRVANIYDLNSKTSLFKFTVPGKSEKILLLLESGVRFHTTKYAGDKSDLPSPFAMKLR